MDDQNDGLSTINFDAHGYELMAYSHIDPAVTYNDPYDAHNQYMTNSHDESCLDNKYDHTACTGTGNNNLHHPVPNHNHPRSLTQLFKKRHHSVSTIPSNFHLDNACLSPGVFSPMSPSMLDANVSSPRTTTAACSSDDCKDCTISECGDEHDICHDIECSQVCDDDDCHVAATPCTDVECLAGSMSDAEQAVAGVLASIGGETLLPHNQITAASFPYASQPFPGQLYLSNDELQRTMTTQSLGMGNDFDLSHLTDDLSGIPNMGVPFHETAQFLSLSHHIVQMHANGDGSGCVRKAGASWIEHVQQEHPQQLIPCVQAMQNTHYQVMPQQVEPASAMGPAFHLSKTPSTIHVAAQTPHNRSSSTASPMSRPQTASSLPETPNTAATDFSPVTAEQFRCKWVAGSGVLCNMLFEDDEALQKHCKEAHLAGLPKTGTGFECQWHNCNRHGVFAQRSKLERHLQTHTGFKPVKCHICNLPLSAKQSLAQHMRTHTGEKPWLCTFPGCQMAFKQQSALTMHMRTHTGEKPLECEICHKRFGESSNLSKHRKTHNMKGQFKCSYCDKDFHRLDQKRRHEKTHQKHNAASGAAPADQDSDNSQTGRKVKGSRVTKSSNTK
ncbi:Zinc-responsive transcriptional regulator ZAP1 [Colletotrichum chlorophyti]|uniref:Zinc-responsive transcriptional regulator ZAP1 n=1 Tax=Colletotrichum chlorophyti TaxID=708187 RepID=A0A1Q8RW50_9PEZI|nr:Zinc-responsive transcriptional regulator ZAP1 [Colletotrichum chlorophyti]